jgi:hypothetical protein
MDGEGRIIDDAILSVVVVVVGCVEYRVLVSLSVSTYLDDDPYEYVDWVVVLWSVHGAACVLEVDLSPSYSERKPVGGREN